MLKNIQNLSKLAKNTEFDSPNTEKHRAFLIS